MTSRSRLRPSRLFDLFTLLTLSNQMVPFVIVGDLSLLRQTYYWGGGAVATVPGPLQYLIYAAIACRSVLAIAHQPIGAARLAVRGAPLVAFAVVAGLSALWSAHPAVVASKAGYFLVVNLAAVSLLLRYRARPFLRLLSDAFVVVVVSNLAFAAIWPDVAIVSYRIDTAFRGYYEHKSGLGTALGLLAPVAMRHLRPGLRPPAGAAIIGLLVVVQSALGLVAFAIGLGAPVLLRRFGPVTPGARRAPWLGLGAALAGTGVGTWLTFDLLLALLGREATLSGRTLIWQTVAPVAAESLVLGHGYKGFFGVVDPLVYGPRLEPIPHPHNALLAAAVDMGLFSALLLVGLVVLVGRMWRIGSRPGGDGDDAAFVGLGLSIATIAVVESSLIYGPGLLWVLFWVGYVRSRPGDLALGAESAMATESAVAAAMDLTQGHRPMKAVTRPQRRQKKWRYSGRRSNSLLNPLDRPSAVPPAPDPEPTPVPSTRTIVTAETGRESSFSYRSVPPIDPIGSGVASGASPVRSASARGSRSRSGYWSMDRSPPSSPPSSTTSSCRSGDMEATRAAASSPA